jgi:hypothetical protein
MVLASGSALADTQTIALEGSGGFLTADFGASHKGAFTDTFTFTAADTAGLTDLSFFNLAYTVAQSVDFTSATINGVTVPVLNATPPGTVPHYSFGGIPPTFFSGGNLVLTISGTSSALGGSYSGIINLSAVPEPATYGMMMGGLAMLGFMARRRKQE